MIDSDPYYYQVITRQDNDECVNIKKCKMWFIRHPKKRIHNTVVSVSTVGSTVTTNRQNHL